MEFTHAHWHHRFENLQLSAEAFYNSIEAILATKTLPMVSAYPKSYFEGDLLTSKREYLRIEYREYTFDVCAAPFGTDFFISWWLTESPGCLYDAVLLIPFIGKAWGNAMMRKSFYQIDAGIMFKETTQSMILQAIDAVIQEKGLRSLTELERQPVKNYTL